MPGLEIAYVTSVYPVTCLPSQNSVMWLHLTVGVAQKWGLAGIPRREYRCLALSNLKKTLLNLPPKTLTIMNLSASCNCSSCYLASSTYSSLLVSTKLWKLWDGRQLQNLKLMKGVRLFLLFKEILISKCIGPFYQLLWTLPVSILACFARYQRLASIKNESQHAMQAYGNSEKEILVYCSIVVLHKNNSGVNIYWTPTM